ncbi:MAG: hypothetical protein AB2A00_06020 [Myxococcota bacterium]
MLEQLKKEHQLLRECLAELQCAAEDAAHDDGTGHLAGQVGRLAWLWRMVHNPKEDGLVLPCLMESGALKDPEVLGVVLRRQQADPAISATHLGLMSWDARTRQRARDEILTLVEELTVILEEEETVVHPHLLRCLGPDRAQRLEEALQHAWEMGVRDRRGVTAGATVR